ncbi:phosphotransferase family protein (plasmid) [Rhodococcus sp. USK10]|uniref:phosphotransferase family protein n=1 Tax=Rhodococcus sp. USK10 TaxID=2789739 RepID=UPI001C5F0C5F|nr:phosphotransferase family protein [Rhodococcus sp. USK10]QYB00287.1 phosphotransferase family protein [Rhodococcus sp. USK10]
MSSSAPQRQFDLAELDTYMAAFLTGDAAGAVHRSLLSGGLSQMTVVYRTGERDADRTVVVRVPPEVGPLEPYEPVVEATLLEAMAELGVPVPRVVLVEADREHVGRAFYATDFISATMTAEADLSDPEEARTVAGAFLDLLVSVHEAPVDAMTVRGTLHDILGHIPAKTPLGVLDRWDAVLERTDIAVPAYHAFLSRWLRARCPDAAGQEVVVHGDFRLANVLWNDQPGSVAAMMDWEEAGLGDPMYDLAWLLMGSFADDDKVFGLATRREFIDGYAERTGRPVDPLRLLWWEVATGWSLLAMNGRATGLVAEGSYHDLRPMLYGYMNRRIAHTLLRKVTAHEDLLASAPLMS